MAAVAGIVLLADGWWLFRSLHAATVARQARDEQRASLEELFRRDPFPAGTNVLVVREDVRRLQAESEQLSARLRSGQAPEGDTLSPALFVQRLQNDVRELVNNEAPIIDGTRCVASGFSFGFDRYLAADANMPVPGDVPRLTRQLRTVENLARLLFAARVNEVRAIRREDFENAREEPAPKAESRSRRRPGHAAPAAPATPRGGGAAAAGKASYTRERYAVEFSARKLPFLDLLNRVVADPMFMIVTDLDVRKRGPDLKLPEPVAAVPAAVAASAAASATGGVAQADARADIPHSQRVVSGPEQDPLIDVRMDIDVIRFEGE
jgi:hypothetical protein